MLPNFKITVTRHGATALGPLQNELMEELWANGPGTPRAIHRRMNERHPTAERAFTTIYTTLGRLRTAGLVNHNDRTAMYGAALTRDDLTAIVRQRLTRALERL